MSVSKKRQSKQSAENVLRSSFVDESKSLSINGFVTAKVGHRITLDIQTTNVVNDTELFSYYDGTDLIMQIRVIYTNGAREIILSVERIA